MGTTSNYSWPIPEDTDLVKDGAEAIRDLGNAIDTSAADFGGGLVHIETQTFSAVSAVDFDGVFSADYDSYEILLSAAASTPVHLRLRFRAGGVSDTSNLYRTQIIFAQSTTLNASRPEAPGTLASFAGSNNIATNEIVNIQINVRNPFATKRTPFNTHWNSNGESLVLGGGSFDGNISFDGIQILPNTGNITGSMSVYGYRKV
jgi:hypothetical protein